jgi:hypothetical protein
MDTNLSLSAISFFLKSPYFMAAAVMSGIKRMQDMPAISQADMIRFRSMSPYQTGTEMATSKSLHSLFTVILA